MNFFRFLWDNIFRGWYHIRTKFKYFSIILVIGFIAVNSSASMRLRGMQYNVPNSSATFWSVGISSSIILPDGTTIYIPTDGNTGEHLFTDGLGNWSWEAPGGGSGGGNITVNYGGTQLTLSLSTITWAFDDIVAIESPSNHITLSLSTEVIKSAGSQNINGSKTFIGTTTFSDTIEAVHIRLIKTATETDDHAFEMTVNSDGFADIKALDINYITGALAVSNDESIILINIDESASDGGDVIALEVLATEGNAKIIGMEVGPVVHPIIQLSGSFGDPDSGVVIDTDNLVSFISTTSNVTIFVVDNDSVTIGNATQFTTIEVLLSTVSSGAGITPNFNYSDGVDSWAVYTPVDGTNAMTNSGVIQWNLGDIPGWVVGVGSEFLISIVRTRNSLTTVPVESKIQISDTIEYDWNKDGDVSVHSLTVSSWTRYVEGADSLDITVPVLTANRAVTFGDVAGEISILGQTIDLTSEVTGTLPVGNGGDTNATKLYVWPGASTLPLDRDENWAVLVKATGTHIDYLTGNFDDTVVECRKASLKVPSDADTSGTVNFWTYWYSDTFDSSQSSVTWLYRWHDITEDVNPFDVVLTTDVASADAQSDTKDQIIVTNWTETMSNLGWTADEWISGQFCRDPGEADDDMNGDARAIGFAMEVPRN